MGWTLRPSPLRWDDTTQGYPPEVTRSLDTDLPPPLQPSTLQEGGLRMGRATQTIRNPKRARVGRRHGPPSMGKTHATKRCSRLPPRQPGLDAGQPDRPSPKAEHPVEPRRLGEPPRRQEQAVAKQEGPRVDHLFRVREPALQDRSPSELHNGSRPRREEPSPAKNTSNKRPRPGQLPHLASAHNPPLAP